MPLDERARHVAGRTPLERLTRFELVVNLKTGNALGVTMPQSILLSEAELIQRCLVCALIAGLAWNLPRSPISRIR